MFSFWVLIKHPKLISGLTRAKADVSEGLETASVWRPQRKTPSAMAGPANAHRRRRDTKTHVSIKFYSHFLCQLSHPIKKAAPLGPAPSYGGRLPAEASVTRHAYPPRLHPRTGLAG